VERRTDSGTYAGVATPAASSTTFSDTGLTASTSYSYRVKAVNGAGSSGWATEVSVTTLAAGSAALTIPTAPSELKIKSVGTNSLTLEWTDNSDNETKFVLERKTASTSYAEVATPAADLKTFSDTGLTTSTAYTYRVKAVNDAGSIPAAPSNLQVKSSGSDSLTVEWTDNSDNETKFVVERKTASGSYAEVATPAAGVTTFSDTGLTASTSYTYRVKSVNSIGSSDWATELAITTLASGNFSEAHTPTTANSAEIRVGKDNSYAKGAGQKIHLSRSYIPNKFTVWIKDSAIYAFDVNDGTDVAVTLQLKIWNTAGTEIGSSSAPVTAGYRGPVTFTITNVTAAIAAEEKVTYAVYLPNAYANNTNGNLEMDNTDGYKTGDSSATVMQTTTANDSTVSVWSSYSSLSRDLRFKLDGTYQ